MQHKQYVTLISILLLICLALPMSVWAREEAQIAFSSNRDGDLEIYVMDEDGKNLRNLTNHPMSDYEPAWSPDGQSIAFVSSRWGTLADSRNGCRWGQSP